MSSTLEAERAVREYLLYLTDPDQLVDEKEVAKLQARVEAASDPIDRLHAIAEFERVRHPLEDTYRQNFVEHAKRWADENQIPPSAFKALGVSDSALDDAGLESSSPSGHRSRRHHVSVGDVRAAAAEIRGTFTAAELAAAARGGSPMTVRKAISQMVNSGTIEKLGPTPNWTAPGRAPIQYRNK